MKRPLNASKTRSSIFASAILSIKHRLFSKPVGDLMQGDLQKTYAFHWIICYC
jgi:hypothetical protein